MADYTKSATYLFKNKKSKHMFNYNPGAGNTISESLGISVERTEEMQNQLHDFALKFISKNGGSIDELMTFATTMPKNPEECFFVGVLVNSLMNAFQQEADEIIEL